MDTTDVEYIGITAAEDYSKGTPQNHNCYSYAVGLSKAANPGDCSIKDYKTPRITKDKPYYDLEEVSAFVDRDLTELNVPHRVISSPDEKKSDEYVVALKVSTAVVPWLGMTDYHFLRQLSDGTWADKPGRSPVRKNYLNPFSSVWSCASIASDFYDSKTVFFAIKDKRNNMNNDSEKPN